MVKQTLSTSPQPEVETEVQTPEAIIQDVQENGEADVIEVPEEVANKAAEYAERRAQRTHFISDKQTLIAQINVSLDEAAKLASAGEAGAAEAMEKSQSAALKLYQGWVSGAFDAAQVTELLGKKFGAKEKGNSKVRLAWASGPTASSTPFGMGEAIRKRVVRAVRAHEFCQSGGTEGVAFFDTLTVDDVQPLVSAVNAGQRSVSTLYDDLAALKTAQNTGTRPKLAFDPARIASITDTIGENIATSLQMVGQSESLFNAYCDLYDMIGLIRSELGVTQSLAA